MVDELEDGVLEPEFCGRAHGEVRVDAVGIGVEVCPLLGLQPLVLRGSQLVPAHRANEGVGVELVVSEHLGQAAGADVSPGVHLPEAILGVHEPLGEEQVVGGRGVQMGDSVVVANDLDPVVETGERDLAFDLGEGPAGRPREEHQQTEQCRRDHDRRPSQDALDDSAASALRRPRSLGLAGSGPGGSGIRHGPKAKRSALGSDPAFERIC